MMTQFLNTFRLHQATFDSFRVSLHSPDGRRFVSRLGCSRGLPRASQNGGYPHRSREPIVHCDTRQSHSSHGTRPLEARSWWWSWGRRTDFQNRRCPDHRRTAVDKGGRDWWFSSFLLKDKTHITSSL